MNIDEALGGTDNMFMGDLARNAIKESQTTAGRHQGAVQGVS